MMHPGNCAIGFGQTDGYPAEHHNFGFLRRLRRCPRFLPEGLREPSAQAPLKPGSLEV